MAAIEAYKSMWKNAFVVKGRTDRTGFWWAVLINTAITIILLILGGHSLAPVSVLYILIAFIPALTLEIRRLHDVNKSGWNILLSFIPLVGSIILIVFLAGDSSPGPNKYGSTV